MKIQCFILALFVFATVAHNESEVETRVPERRPFFGRHLSRLENSENQNEINNGSRRRHHHFTHNADWHRRHGIPLPDQKIANRSNSDNELGNGLNNSGALSSRFNNDELGNRSNSDVLATSALAANITSEECLTKEQHEQDNLKVVLSFYEEAFGQHDITAVDKYISPDYIQHNPHVADGKQPLVDFLIPFNAIKVKGPVDIRHTAVNGDLVWLHLKTTGFNGEPLAIIDVFRVKDGKIVEHWDVIQAIPPLKESKNPHPMF